MEHENSKKIVLNVVRRRATCRNFNPEPLSDDVVDRLTEAACLAPSAGGFQRVSIITVREKEKKEQLARLSRNQGFIANAPLNLVFCIDHRRMRRIAEFEQSPSEPGKRITSLWMGIVDAVIAAQTVVLAAESLGLRSCYNGNILSWPKEMSELLELPEGVIPAIMLTVGYPKSSRSRTSRKYAPEVIVHEEVYRDLPMEELYEAHKVKFPETYKLTPGRRDAFSRTLSLQRGEEYAVSSLNEIEQAGRLTAYQYWFGCYYSDEGKDAISQAEYLEYLADQGFDLGSDLRRRSSPERRSHLNL